MNVGAVLLLFVAAVVAVVLGFPATDDLSLDQLPTAVWEVVEEPEVPVAEEGESGVRVRRATCDLLSVSLPIGSLNHAACAAHCLSKRRGYRGGRCKDGVCHCRK